MKIINKDETMAMNRKLPKKKPKQFPWFMPFACEGCGDCVKACPNNCIKLMGLNRKVPVAWLEYPDYCLGCGICADTCVADAIQMTKYVDKAIERYKIKKKPFE
ncbi:MAG: NADH-quinone oxidoreductase subunit I [Promethearchaeota archaeon]